MYRVVLRKQAEKALGKIDKRYRSRILQALIALRENPFSGKPLLGGLRGYFTLRVWPYRIIYRVYQSDRTVHVISIGHRQGAY